VNTERANREQVEASALALAGQPVVRALLDAAGVPVVVLNREHEIIVGNKAFLAELCMVDAGSVQGLRLGEALGCVFSGQCSGGCGTASGCAMCGSVLAVLASQTTNAPVEQECLMSVRRGARIDAYELRIHATPVEIGGQRLTIVGMRDISAEKRRDALERVFLHDISNTLGTLLLRAEMLAARGPVEVYETTHMIKFLAERMRREIEDQYVLLQAENGTLDVEREPVRPEAALEMAAGILRGHPVARGRKIKVMRSVLPAVFTDEALLVRVLVNMIKNALEATPEGGEVRIWAETVPEGCEFRVWNRESIPPLDALQVFKRSFSTKPGRGRGLGTFGMKLLGEGYLGATVGFGSTEADGTTFFLRLPVGTPAT